MTMAAHATDHTNPSRTSGQRAAESDHDSLVPLVLNDSETACEKLAAQLGRAGCPARRQERK